MPLNIADLAITTSIPAGERIPDAFTADGGNQTPQVTVSGVPEGATELAIIVHDPDAPLPHGFTHWVLYGVPAVDGEVDVEAARSAPNGTTQTGWFGPQPPAGHGTHHYYFWVYALDRAVEGTPTREAFLADYADAIVEQNRTVGTFSA